MAEKPVQPDPSDPSNSAASATEPPPVHFDRADWISFSITAALALAAYLFTLAPGLTLESSGMMSTAAYYGGVAIPPGHPAWTLYTWIFIHLLPFSNIAWRVNVSSAVAASLACGLAAVTVSFIGKLLMEDSARFSHFGLAHKRRLRIVCGYVAGMALGFGPLWYSAATGEYFAFSFFLFTVVLCLATRWLMQRERKRFLCGAFFALGVLLTSSQEMIGALPALVVIGMLGNAALGRDLAFAVLPTAGAVTLFCAFGWFITPPFEPGRHRLNVPLFSEFVFVAALGLAIAIFRRRLGATWKFALLCNVSFLIGFSLYLYLPLASMTNPPVNWGYSRTVEGFIHAVNRGQFERLNPTNNWPVFRCQLKGITRRAGRDLGWHYLFLAALAVCAFPVMRPKIRRWLAGMVVMLVGSGPVVLAMLNPIPERATMDLIDQYFMPAHACLSLLAGVGLMICAQFVKSPATNQPAQPPA